MPNGVVDLALERTLDVARRESRRSKKSVAIVVAHGTLTYERGELTAYKRKGAT